MSYPLNDAMTCRLKDIGLPDVLLIASLGATVLLTLEVAFVILMDFVDRLKKKKAQRAAAPDPRRPGPC